MEKGRSKAADKVDTAEMERAERELHWKQERAWEKGELGVKKAEKDIREVREEMRQTGMQIGRMRGVLRTRREEVGREAEAVREELRKQRKKMEVQEIIMNNRMDEIKKIQEEEREKEKESLELKSREEEERDVENGSGEED